MAPIRRRRVQSEARAVQVVGKAAGARAGDHRGQIAVRQVIAAVDARARQHVDDRRTAPRMVQRIHRLIVDHRLVGRRAQQAIAADTHDHRLLGALLRLQRIHQLPAGLDAGRRADPAIALAQGLPTQLHARRQAGGLAVEVLPAHALAARVPIAPHEAVGHLIGRQPEVFAGDLAAIPLGLTRLHIDCAEQVVVGLAVRNRLAVRREQHEHAFLVGAEAVDVLCARRDAGGVVDVQPIQAENLHAGITARCLGVRRQQVAEVDFENIA